MSSVRQLTDGFAVASQPSVADFADLAGRGFRTIVNMRLDSEDSTGSRFAAERTAAEAAGLTYLSLPVSKLRVFTDEVIDALGEVMRSADGPVLAHCASGQRAAIVWAALTVRQKGVDPVLAALRAAGFQLDFLRDDLESQADRGRWNSESGNAAERSSSAPGVLEPA